MSAADALPAIPTDAKPTMPSQNFFIAVFFIAVLQGKVPKSLPLHSVTAKAVEPCHPKSTTGFSTMARGRQYAQLNTLRWDRKAGPNAKGQMANEKRA